MKIRQSKETRSVDFPNSLVVFSLKSYRSYILNNTASEVWNFCKGLRDSDEIVKFLSKRYNISISKARRDINRLIADLKKKGLFLGCSSQVTN